MCVGVSVWLSWGGIRMAGWSTKLQPAIRILPQLSHTETPTHIETRTHNQCGDTIEKSQAPDDGCIKCPKHVEHTRSEIKLNKLWHQVGLLFFNYHNDARSNIHKTRFVFDNVFPPRKSCRLWDNVEKYGRAGLYNTAHALCLLDNYGYRRTLRIGNTFGFARQCLHERVSMLRFTYIACLGLFTLFVQFL